MPADGVGQLRAIADQPVTHTDQHQCRLLLGRLRRHEAHRRPAHRLTQRFGIGRIVLAALDIRFDQLRRNQLHSMPKRVQQPRPEVARTARSNRDHRRRKILEKHRHILAPKLPAQNRLLGRVHSMKLKNALRRIHPYSDNMVHGRPPLSEICNNLSLAHSMPFGGRPPQHSGGHDPWGTPPERKYEVSNAGDKVGPGLLECLGILRATRQPVVDIAEFARRVIFNYLVGNADAHAKNFSLLYEDSSRAPVLAPAYDIVCTRLYPEFDDDFPMVIGSARQPADLDADQWRNM